MPARTCDVAAGTRTCGSCGETLPASPEFFSKKSASPDGYVSHCKLCAKAYNKQWHADNRERVAEANRKRKEANPERAAELGRRWWAENRERRAGYDRKWYSENRGQKAEYSRRYATKNPEKARAQHAVNYALKANRLAKPTQCEDCNKEARLHGHHPDYTQPLEVDWLCPLCHSARHKKTRITHETLPQPTALENKPCV